MSTQININMLALLTTELNDCADPGKDAQRMSCLPVCRLAAQAVKDYYASSTTCHIFAVAIDAEGCRATCVRGLRFCGHRFVGVEDEVRRATVRLNHSFGCDAATGRNEGQSQ